MDHDVRATDDEETRGSGSGPRALTPGDLPPGTIVDKYRLGAVLGQGGMGLVVAAEHVQLRELVALKFLRVDGEQGQDFRSRFRREAQICAQIKNEHITRVLDVGSYKEADYMVMEHLTGSDLRGYMRRTSPIPVATAVDFAVQACVGLAEVHARGVVHRDLKPSNLFVTQRSDGTPLIKILDFGISKWASEMDTDDDLTKTGAVLGSPKYMAPEQLFGSSTVDARADIWSIGAILYEMLTGKPPFDESTFARLCVRISSAQPPSRPRERRPEITEELDEAVMLCLNLNLATRLPNVAAVAGELLAAIGDPLADPVRERLQAVLDGSTTPSISSVPTRSGQYVAASLSSTGSHSGRVLASTVSASAVDVAATPPRDRKKAIYALAALVAVVALFFLFRKSPSPPSVVEPPRPAAVEKAALAAPSVAPVAPIIAASAPVIGASAPLAASASAAPKFYGKTKPIVATKSAEPTAAPIVTPPPPPVATTATAKATGSPLEDRQ